MAILPFSAVDRAAMYAHQQKLTIDKTFGGGVDGIVVGTTSGTAIKSLNHPQLYRQELAIYQYMLRKEIFSIGDFIIPKLVNWDNDNCIIEMSIVTPPFVLDFVGAKLQEPEPFSDEILEYWREQKREEFGDDWPLVNRLIYAFRCRGIFLTDVHKGNVACR